MRSFDLIGLGPVLAELAEWLAITRKAKRARHIIVRARRSDLGRKAARNLTRSATAGAALRARCLATSVEISRNSRIH